MKLRSVVFWPHLIAGIVAGLVILVMSVTGVLLTYERQMIAWADSGFQSTAPRAEAAPLTVEALLTRVRSARPELAVTAVTVGADAGAPVVLTAGPQTLYADAYTGAILGSASQGMRRFMSETRAWHRWLSQEGSGRPLARAVTGWANLLFLFVVISGFYLWFPRQWTWRHLRPLVAFRSGLRGKARDFNWHNAIGVWSAIPLFIVVFSAVPISFPWANALVYRALGEAVPAPGGGREGNAGAAGRAGRAAVSVDGLDARLQTARAQAGDWQTINMRLPNTPSAPVVFAIDRGDGGQPHLRSTLTLDRATGAVLSYQTFADQSRARQLRSLMRFAHTGEVLGIPGQTVAGIATAGSIVLVWTGFALSFRRCRGWLARRRTQSAAAVADAA